jgi:predicted P-loop ATPase
MYIRLFNGGKSYLTREVQSSFHQHFPMSNRAQGVVENNLDIMKAGIVKIVTPLMKNESQLDIAMTPVKWLTCTQVKGADYLWDPEIEPEQDVEQEAKQGAEQSAEQGAEQAAEIQPVSEKAKGKRRAVEASVETGPSVEPIRKKGKGRAIMPFEEEDVDAEEDEDAEFEEV